MQPEVSIITPAYNASKFIEQTIKSVQDQSFKDWEMIIVDDGSKDGTFELVQRLSKLDPRIVVAQQKNQGPAPARNKALSLARGRFICFLDSDDLWLPNKLETQIGLMKKNNWALSFTQFRRITLEGKEFGPITPIPSQVSYRQLLTHNVIACLTAMVDRSITGNFVMSTEGYDDFILWLTITKQGHLAHGIQQDLARYRIVPGSISSKRGRAIKWVWNIYRRVEKFSVPKAAFLMSQYLVKVSAKHLSVGKPES